MNAWGASFGISWGDSWGASSPALTPTTPGQAGRFVLPRDMTLAAHRLAEEQEALSHVHAILLSGVLDQH